MVKLNFTTQIKKLWLWALDLAKKNFWGSKKSAIFLVLIFVTDVGVLIIDTFF